MISKLSTIAIYLHVCLKISNQVFQSVFYNKRKNNLKWCTIFFCQTSKIICMVSFGHSQISILTHTKKLSIEILHPQFPKLFPILAFLFHFFSFCHSLYSKQFLVF